MSTYYLPLKPHNRWNDGEIIKSEYIYIYMQYEHIVSTKNTIKTWKTKAY